MALLEIRDLTHSFGGLTALQDYRLKLEPGEFVGLIGPNGAGKTTVFNLACGFYQPTRGDILLLGETIKGLRPHSVTSLGLSRTFQNIRLWNSLTVLENLCISQHSGLGYGLVDAVLRNRRFRESERRTIKAAEEVLEIMGLSRFASELPKNLPYGMQRRVEIGRALASRPKLLLLDEPAAGMNPGEIDQLIETIRWIHEHFSLTIWLIEHHMRVVMTLCNRIQVLNFGRIICEGSPQEVCDNEKVIEAYLGGGDSGNA